MTYAVIFFMATSAGFRSLRDNIKEDRKTDKGTELDVSPNPVSSMSKIDTAECSYVVGVFPSNITAQETRK